MKILIYDWLTNIGSTKLIQDMKQYGWIVKVFRGKMKDYFIDPDFEDILCKEMEEVDAVFSFNFYPAISRNCYIRNKKYVSYCFDTPLFNLFSKETLYETNYIFVFDMEQMQELRSIGAKNVHYLPMACNMDSREVKKPVEYQCEVSFIGQLYRDNLYRETKEWPERLKGFMEGIMSAQKIIYGADILKDVIPTPYMDAIEKFVTLQFDQDRYIFTDKKMIFLFLVLEKEISCREREEIIKLMAGNFDFHLYTFCDTPEWPEVKNLGMADYDNQLSSIYQTSKVNLNITAKHIHHGVPMRVFDILGSGGFCISNYQRGLEDHFELGTDLVVYDDYRDLMYKTAYYLEHEEERLQIAENGKKKVREYHLYKHRLQEIERIVMGEKGENQTFIF